MDLNIKELNAKRAIQLERQSPYNIINHGAEFPERSKEDENKENAVHQSREYNIISNLHLEKHHYLPPDKRPKERQVLEHVRSRTDTKEKRTLSNRPRDFDVVSNVYLEADDEKQNIDRYRDRLLAQVKLETSQRNPITGQGVVNCSSRGKRTYQTNHHDHAEVDTARRHVHGKSRYETEKEITQHSREVEDTKELRMHNRRTSLRNSVEERRKRDFNIITNK